MITNQIIAVDFDGTCVDHRYPEIGADVPYAAAVLKELVKENRLILWTMRSERWNLPEAKAEGRNVLQEAVDWFTRHGIPLFGINENPEQKSWTSSPKAHCHLLIDDRGIGCPLKENPRAGGSPYVDWRKVAEILGVEI